MVDAKYLLTDEAMRDFILNGYLVVKPDLPVGLFERAYEQSAEAVKTGRQSKGLVAHAPALREILRHEAVRGALTSILGPTYRNNAEHRCHHMPPQPEGVTPGWHVTDVYPFHKDANIPARHRCRMVMSVFFPHDCPPDRGPTAIIPGSQYFTRSSGAYCHQSMQTTATAGTIHFIHYDMWHGGTCNYTNLDRYMMKFTFVRADEPTEPSWNCKDTTWRPVKQGPSGQQLNDLWECMWNWHCGRNGLNGAARLSGQRRITSDIPKLVASLRDEDENVSLQSAYALARLGEPAIAPLLDKLIEESAVGPAENLHGRKPEQGGDGGKPCEVYYAGYALAAIGAAAAPGLASLLRYKNWWVRGAAADTLREMGRPGMAAAEALTEALRDENETVRSYAAEALGTIAPVSKPTTQALLALLGDPALEVSRSAAQALARIRPTPELAVPALVQALEHKGGQVRQYASMALERMGTAEARSAVAAFFAARPDDVCLTA